MRADVQMPAGGSFGEAAHFVVPLPGALLFAAQDLETKHQEIPRDRDIILYCT